MKEIIQGEKSNLYSSAMSIGAIGGTILLFIFSILLMMSSIDSVGYSFVNYSIRATSNPFIGLFIGLLSTAILQSSSTTTTLIVAAVASGSLGLPGAIPMIMGANIGTTLTSTLVSLSYITRKKEFRKAVAAGTIHDFYNILMVLILFPLEINYHLLEQGSTWMSSYLGGVAIGNEGSWYSFSWIFNSINTWLIDVTHPAFALILAVFLIFICIKFISKLLYDILIGRTKEKFETTIFSNTLRSFGWGLLITSIAQSSTLTTSLIVPLVATGKVKLKRAFQFILGANVGTTITALLVAIFNSKIAISLALVHLLFNLIGVIIFLLVPYLSKVPVYLAKKMGKVTVRVRFVGFAYIFLAFFLLPFTLIYFSKATEKQADPVEVVSED